MLYKIEEYIVTDTLTLIKDVSQMLVKIFLMVHLMAWTFFFIGDYSSSTEPLTWINKNHIQDLYPIEQYITAIYFSYEKN